MITWLASYPRSGNTFFRILLNRLYGVNTYSVYNDRIFEERPEVANLVGHRHTDRSVADMAASPEPCLLKTHDLPGDDAYPAIYLVRDGRDALVSYAHFALAFEAPESPANGADAFLTMLRNLVISTEAFGGWSANVLAWANARQAPTAIVKFEDLIADPIGMLEAAYRQLPLGSLPPRVGASVPSFDDLRGQLPAFFRRGLTGAWREEMPPDIHDLFWEHHFKAMAAMGYASE
jgi:hypothetical protein